MQQYIFFSLFEKVAVRSESNGNQYYSFGKSSKFIEADPPVVLSGRNPTNVWEQVMKVSGWKMTSNRSDSNIRLARDFSPGKIGFSKLNSKMIISQLPGYASFDKDALVRLSRQKQNSSLNFSYDILPRSFILPQERKLLERFQHNHQNPWFIDKPTYGSLGKGIVLTKRISDLKISRIVQQYLTDTATYFDHKFDLRVFLLVTSVNPLIAYVYQAGYAKVAALKYELPTIQNQKFNGIHLTNFAQAGQLFEKEKCIIADQLKPLVAFDEVFEHLYINYQQFTKQFQFHILSLTLYEFKQYMWDEINKLMQKVLIIVYDQLLAAETNVTGKFYAKYGADVMMLRNGELKLIEVNRRPQQYMICDVQREIDPNVVSEELNIVGIPIDNETVVMNHNDSAKSSFSKQQLLDGVHLEYNSLNLIEKEAIDQFSRETDQCIKFKRIFPTYSEQTTKQFNQLTQLNLLLYQWLKQGKVDQNM